MVEYGIGFEEEFSKQIYERWPDALNMYEAEELQKQALISSIEILESLGYDARINLEGQLEVDRKIDPRGLESIKQVFDSFRIKSFGGEDLGPAHLVIQELPLEKITALKPTE